MTTEITRQAPNKKRRENEKSVFDRGRCSTLFSDYNISLLPRLDFK